MAFSMAITPQHSWCTVQVAVMATHSSCNLWLCIAIAHITLTGLSTHRTACVGSICSLHALASSHILHAICRAGRQDQVYLEVVQGFGETLVGNYPGQALQATVNKQALSGLLEDHSSLGADVQSISQQAVTVNSYPSKSIALRLLGSSTASTKNAEFFFRSDSNGEDLEG